MSLLTDSLPSLNSYTASTGTSSYMSPSSDSGSVGSKILGAAANAATGGLASALPIQRIVMIVLGLVVIAAGLFMFKPVHETVVQVAKDGAAAAAV